MQTGVDRIVENLGGTPEKNKTGVDKILEILENGGGGGSSLPEVTSSDEGKVLAVNASGEWTAELKAIYFSSPTGNISYNIAKDYLTKGIIVICGNLLDNPTSIGLLLGVFYNSEAELYAVVFIDGSVLVSSDPDDDQMVWD